MHFPVDPARVTQVAAGLPAGQAGIEMQIQRNKQINDMVMQVQERAAMGAQLAGRSFAAQRDIANQAGLTLPRATQMMTDRHNYAHNLNEIKDQHIAFGEHESFFGNMDPVTQMQGLEVANKYDSMTPQQQRIASMGARAAKGPMTPFNRGFQANLLLIQQQRLRENSIYSFV